MYHNYHSKPSIPPYLFLTRTITQTVVHGYIRKIFFKKNYTTADIESLITKFTYDDNRYKTFRLLQNKFCVKSTCCVAIPMNERTILCIGKDGLLSFFCNWIYFLLLFFLFFFVCKFCLIEF